MKNAQVNQFAVSMGTNSPVVIPDDLRRRSGSARVVWGLKDALFG